MNGLIELKPARDDLRDYDEIEEKIKALFRKKIYSPLIREFNEPVKKLTNALESLVSALQSGRLTYNRGKFSGKLNATLSKELRSLGAKWNRIEKCYSIPQTELPIEVKNAVASGGWRFQQKIDSIDRKLAEIVPEEVAKELKLTKIFDQSIYKAEKEFEASVKNLTVPPQFTAERRKALSEKWQKNMDLWVTDFTKKEIKSLREDIKQSVFAGNRYEHAIKSIQKSYGVTENKAKFLARQETALAMTTYKYARYQEAGINEYKWKSVVGTSTHPVRARHKELNDESAKGKTFRFDDPPVTSAAGEPARRNNPKQDYNCRCVAIPVVRFK